MERVQQGFPATLTFTTSDAAATVGTVTVKRDDGTVLVNAAAATSLGGGVFSYTLATAHTGLLDLLKVTFTGTVSGQSVSTTTAVEVVGGFPLFPLSALKNHPDVLRAGITYTDAQLADARIWAEQRLERVCGQAFVPRYTRKFVTSLTRDVYLDPLLRAIRTVKQAGTLIGGTHTFTGAFLRVPTTRKSYEVAYEHGRDQPDSPINEAALTLAKIHLIRGPITDRATQIPTESGSINLATPGVFGSWFGIPEVDAVAAEYRMPVLA